jgi:hypothetical protein
VEVKQREDEIASVAKQLVTLALVNAEKSFAREKKNNGNSSNLNNVQNNKQNKPGFYEAGKNETKYHRVFGQ